MSDGRHQHPNATPDDLPSSSILHSGDDNLQTSRTSLLFHVPVSFHSPDQARYSLGHETEDEDAHGAGYEITYSQNPSVRRWRKATLALNATRRFRHTAQHSERVNRIRTATHAVRAARRFQRSIVKSPVNGHGRSHSCEDFPYSVGQIELQSLDNAGPEIAIHRMEASPSNLVTGAAPSELSLRAKLSKIVQDRDPEYLADLGGVDGVSKLLNVDLERGLDDDPIILQNMTDEFGSNRYPEQPSKSFFSFVLDACRDPTLIILIVCAVLSLAFGMKSHGPKEGWYDGTSILFAVILVVLVTSISDYRQSLQFKVLNDEKKNIMIHVIRGGRRINISIFDLVVGDLVSLNIGDQVPADGIFVSGHSLTLDESSMTGESEPVPVDSKSPYLLSGCKVVDGYGIMLVTGVGMETEWGKLMAVVGEDLGEETPLQMRLNDVATFVGQIGLAVALLVFVILLIFYFTGRTNGSGNSGKFKAHQTSASDAINSVVDIFAIAVTIVVVAVPEGLPLAVTLSLAYAMRKMMADRALVRRLSACETMGSATVICTDKTGTLTTNVMTVTKVWLEEEIMDADHVDEIDENLKMVLFEGIAQNSSTGVFVTPDGQTEVVGSPTEKAVLVFGLKMGMNFQLQRSRSKILQVETFNSAKKKAGVAVEREDGRVYVHWKGAAEIVLESCDKVLAAGGSKHPISDHQREQLLRIIEAMASQSLRCIALGYMEMRTEDVPIGEQLEVWKIPEGPLTLIAILGMKDPSRPGVREAVEKCKNAKVKVIMLTGDNLVTAKAIATEVGILWTEDQLAIDGYTFRNYSDQERKKTVPRISVIARTTPTDKHLMVRTLKEMGEVVAVTGDGTNDAPALHDADIGLAMGIQGTEVAKESSDIIILDDNFATVVKVLRWGRSIYVNIQKFIQFQLTVNVAALTINFVAAVSTGDVPLTAVQLLWVNLIMDTLGALALATEPPSDELLDRAPVGRTEPLVTNVMARNILLQAAYQVTVLLTLQFRGKQLLRLQSSTKATDINNTVIFNAFVFCQLFNEVNARRPEEKNIFRGIFNNMLFLGIIASTAVLQVIIVEFLNKFASTVKLSWQYWLVSIGIGFLSWPIALIGKFIPVPKKPIMQFHLLPCGKKEENEQRVE